MKILDDFRSSIYDTKFYAKIETKPFKTVLWFYFKVAVIISFIVTIFISISVLPNVKSFLSKDSPNSVANYFPDELIFTLENGKVRTNVEEPYVIPFNIEENDAPENFAVIDTRFKYSESSIDDLDMILTEYNTFILIAEDYIAFRESNEPGASISVQSLNGITDFVASKDSLNIFLGNFDGNGFIILSIIAFFAFWIIYLMDVMLKLVFLLILALVTLVIVYFANKTTSYKTAYKISMYAVLPTIAITYLLNFIGISFTFLFTLIFAVIVFYNTRG